MWGECSVGNTTLTKEDLSSPHKRQLAPRLATTAIRQAVGIYLSEQSAVSSAPSAQLTSPALWASSPDIGEEWSWAKDALATLATLATLVTPATPVKKLGYLF